MGGLPRNPTPYAAGSEEAFTGISCEDPWGWLLEAEARKPFYQITHEGSSDTVGCMGLATRGDTPDGTREGVPVLEGAL